MNDRLAKLENLVDTLRGPNGCPWDREQSLSDLRAYLLEEAHELAAAIDDADPEAIREELGDLLFHIVFISRLIEQPSEGPALTKVVDILHQKMVDRHPHVFGDEVAEDSEAVHHAWETRKAQQRSGSVLSGVPSTLPALLGAYRISQKAAGVGFDWPDVAGVVAKLEEELGEVVSALAQDSSQEAVEEEVGELLFATANLARKLGFDPESALQRANRKFKRRFEAMEARLNPAEQLSEQPLERLEELWNRAKKEDRRPS